MPKKHFLNGEYPDLYYRGSTRTGRYKQVVLNFRRGDGPMPKVEWDITVNSPDAPYFDTPVADLVGSNDAETKHFYVIKLPNVGGVEYTVRCRIANGRWQTVDSFQTWRRITLDAECPDEQCLRIFRTAFSRLQTALKPAFIELKRGEEKITGENRNRHEAPSSNLGCDMTVTFTLPRWEAYGQKFELTVTDADVTGHTRWSRHDNLLICTLPTDVPRKFRPQVPKNQGNVHYIEAIEVTCEGKSLLKMPLHNGFFPADETKAYLELCKIRKNGVAVTAEADVHDATDIILDLDSAPLQTASTALAAGKTVKISVTLGLEQLGRSAGGAAENSKAFRLTFYPDTTARQMVNVLSHELAHTMYLVKKQETFKDGTKIENLMYHGNDYGGNGPHCRHNAKSIQTGATTSGFTYEYDRTKGPLCTMHYKTDPGVDEGKFCANCIAQLRRATLPGEHRDAIDPED